VVGHLLTDSQESDVKNKKPATQLEVKAVLNRIQHFVGFIYQSIRMRGSGSALRLEVKIEPHQSIRGKCSTCLEPCPGYDTLEERRWLFVPMWGIIVHFFYAPRRVECAEHGVGVEHIPWSQGKSPVTTAMMGFLARWARRLSWRETARTFQTSWEAVYHSVEWFVTWGLAHRDLTGIQALGIDEIHWGQGKRADQFLTVIYQIDGHCCRLLWLGRRRSQATLRRGLNALGPPVLSGLRFVCSDMWQPYLTVVAQMAGHALHVLDRFHIVSHLNKAVDEVRRAESTRLRGQPLAAKLKKMRWKLLRKGSRVRGQARLKLEGLLASKMATGRAWDLKECFDYFWHYKSATWAGAFLDYWTKRAMRSRLEPMKKVARMLRKHEGLLLNWFKAKGELSSGRVEGLNNKIRVVTRRSYGFRTYKAMELALYHTLGRLPEPETTHRFC
jgi:transposase